MMIHYLLSLFFCWTEKSGNWQVSGSFNNDSNKPVPHFVAHFFSIKKKGKIFENSKRFIQSDSEKYAPANIPFVDLLKKKIGAAANSTKADPLKRNATLWRRF